VDGLDVVVAPFFQARIVADRHYRQGIGFESRGQWERALQSFRTACDLHPQRVLYLVARGRVCQAHGLENEAAACYALARKVDPSDPVTLFNQADLLARRGDLDAAVTNLHTLLDTHGDSLGARVASVWQLLGDLELARRNVGAAIGAYRRGADARSPDPYLTTVVQADKRLRDVAASDDTAARIDGDGVVFPAKAAIYAFAGAMLLGLPDDDGIEVPTYPGLGFISVDEVAQALARPLALFRRRHEPFVAVHAVEEAATPVAQAIASMLGIPIGMHPDGPRLSIGLVGEDPSALRRDEAHRGDWSFCLGLRHPAWRYSGVLDGALVVAEVEVPWVSVDARARRPDRDVATALVEALVRTDPCDDVISRHLKWHGTRSHLRAGDPASTYSPNPV
jgi:tetratricopeptide (TPR) repeat protein